MAYHINYHQVMRQADKIEDEAHDIQKEIRQLDELIDDIQAIWKSPAATVFLAECQTLRHQMQAAQSRINQAANSIRETARRIKEADDRAAEAATKIEC